MSLDKFFKIRGESKSAKECGKLHFRKYTTSHDNGTENYAKQHSFIFHDVIKITSSVCMITPSKRSNIFEGGVQIISNFNALFVGKQFSPCVFFSSQRVSSCIASDRQRQQRMACLASCGKARSRWS